MIQAIPAVADEECFALKGGTAINLFVRDMPRLSVDLDLVYLPLEPRDQALANIGAELERIAEKLHRQMPDCHVSLNRLSGTGPVARLLIEREHAVVKIEPNTVIRGTLFAPVKRELVSIAEDLFEQAVSIQVASLPDLYGGKLCAAMDRQHPRDLFDVLLLMKNEGLSEEIMGAFVVYLASHNRPMHELLDPRPTDISSLFDREFSGMTREPVSLEDLLDIRDEMIQGIRERLTAEHKRFLLGFKQGDPEWSLLPFENLSSYPALQWKLINIRKMNKKKHAEQLGHLMQVLGVES